MDHKPLNTEKPEPPVELKCYSPTATDGVKTVVITDSHKRLLKWLFDG